MTGGTTPRLRAGGREWLGLAVIALPCLLYSMDLTVLNLAVPSLSADLKPSSTQLLWIIDIYGFLVAGSLITMGTLGDRIGRRRLLLIGAAAFGVASVLAAFSRSPAMLITTRAVLGLAGATLAPSTMSLIRNMFLDPGQRSVAIGVWIASYSAGAVIGPPLGGVLLQHFWWGSVFLVSVPMMALLLALGPMLLPEFRDPTARPPDVLSAGLSMAAVLGVIYGLKQIAAHGLAPLPALCIAAALAIGVVFVRRQRTLADPLIDLRLFRTRAFTVSLAVYLLATFAVFGPYVFIAQYLQLVLGLSPMHAGLWSMPFAGGFVVGSILSPIIARRVRPALLMSVGLVLAAFGFAALAQVDGASGLALLATSTVIFSLGLSPVFTLANDLIIGVVPPKRAGAAAGISETCSELGGALGIAILGSIGTAIYRSAMAGAVLDGLPHDAADAARDTLGGAVAVAGQVPGLGTALLDAARTAFTSGLHVTALASALVVIGMAILVVVSLRHVRPASVPEPTTPVT
ncbi:MAG TPA: MFS transporter [Gemmatimonadales bacterium]|jgi:DHA2 family multidrug resistance protein-like MFS transporter|nr:MFS transporter [Gemmatimonadales bacterium]